MHFMDQHYENSQVTDFGHRITGLGHQTCDTGPFKDETATDWLTLSTSYP